MQKYVDSNIKFLRQKNDMSQVKLAKLLNMDIRTIQRYESSEIANLKLDVIERMALIFNVHPGKILYEDLSKK